MGRRDVKPFRSLGPSRVCPAWSGDPGCCGDRRTDGAALAMELRPGRRTVLWASSGRSADTDPSAPSRPTSATPRTVEELAESSDVILSVCPPHAALAVAESVAGFRRASTSMRTPCRPRRPARSQAIVEGGGAIVRGRRDRRSSSARGRADAPLPLGRAAPDVARSLRDTLVQAAGPVRRARLRLGGEDGSRHGRRRRRSPARDPGARSRRGSRGVLARGVAGVHPCPSARPYRRSQPATRAGVG